MAIIVVAIIIVVVVVVVVEVVVVVVVVEGSWSTILPKSVYEPWTPTRSLSQQMQRVQGLGRRVGLGGRRVVDDAAGDSPAGSHNVEVLAIRRGFEVRFVVELLKGTRK